MVEEVRNYNFEILEQELKFLLKSSDENSKILLIPLGTGSETNLRRFLKWLPKEERQYFVVPPMCMPHYSPAGWNSEKSKIKTKQMQKWCQEHII